MRRNAIREVLQVNFQTRTDLVRTLAVFGNHWQSCSGGKEESVGYRSITGETLAFFHERVLDIHGKDAAVPRSETSNRLMNALSTVTVRRSQIETEDTNLWA